MRKILQKPHRIVGSLPTALSRWICFYLFFTLFIGGTLFANSVSAQFNAGLPGGPTLKNHFQNIQMISTNCDKCKNAESEFHAQIDRYDVARAAYDAQLAIVRAKADAYVAARAEHNTLNGLFERLSNESDALLFDRSEDRSMQDYYDAQDARDAAEPDAIAARQKLDAARAQLDTVLRRLENLRTDAIAEMRAANRLQSAMHRCELSCSVNELDLEEPLVSVGQPTDQISVSDIPQPENFIGIVAKCANCQPLAELVNTIRSHRRSFAVSAVTTFESLTANIATLDRLRREAIVLKQQESELFRRLLDYFNARGPGETASTLDNAFDEGDQLEAERALRNLSAARAQNALDIAGLTEVVTQQRKGLQEAIANYHIHTALLEAARQKLAACEKTCKAEKDEISIGDPYFDPNYPRPANVDPILAACLKCQPIADSLMQILSDRRRVANDIQDAVWLVKGRHKSLGRWENELDKLDREERRLGRILLMAYDTDTGATVNERAILDRLFEIESAKTRLTIDLLWAEDEIQRLEKSLKEWLAEHAALTARAAELRAQLAACEKTCGEEEEKEISLGDGLYDPAYPEPVSFFGVLSECAECQPLAEQLNDLLSDRYRLASDIQSAVARLKHNKPLLEERQARLKEILAREQVLNPIWAQPENTPERQAVKKKLNEIDLERRIVEVDVAALATLNAQDEAALEEMLQQHAALDQKIATKRAELATCEDEKCKGGEDGTLTSLPGQDQFVTTDCPPCEQIASMVNDAVGTLIGAERDLKAAKEKSAALEAAATARDKAIEDVLARESALNEEWLTSSDANRQAEINTELNDVDIERNRLTDERAEAETVETQAQTDLEAAQARVDELTKMVADLKAQLAECEKQCAPGGNETGLDVPEEESPFVSTDCPPCEQIASMVNDAVGTLIGAERDLKAAKEKSAALEAAATARDKAIEDVLARESALNEEWLTSSDANRQAEINTELNDVDIERNRLTDERAEAETVETQAQTDLEAAQARVDELTKMVADLKAQLAECEKQCAPGGNETGLDVPEEESPFVSTDCPPCEQIASLLNDVIGSIKTTEAELADASDRYHTREAEIATKEAKKTTAQDAFTKALVEKAGLEANGEGASAQSQIIDEELQRAADLLSEIEDLEMSNLEMGEQVETLQARLADLKAQEKVLRAQLEECEKQCSETEESAMSVNEDPAQTELGTGFVLTKLQPESCTGGKECAFEITAKNNSPNSYSGPLFIFETRRVESVSTEEGHSDLHCSSARDGQSLCLATVKAASGQAFTFGISVKLPRRVMVDYENCVYLGVAKNDRTLNQMIQAGLNARGLNAGSADGVPGRRTRAAIASFAAKSDLEFDQTDPASVFRALFGTDPVRVHIGDGGNSCSSITAKPGSRSTSPSAPTPPSTPTDKPKKPKWGISINIGTPSSGHTPRETENGGGSAGSGGGGGHGGH